MFPGAAPTYTSSIGSGWLGQEPEGLRDSWGPQVWSGSQGPSHPVIQHALGSQNPRGEGTCPDVRWVRSSRRTRGPESSLHVVKGAGVPLLCPLPHAPPHRTSALIHPHPAAGMCTFPGSATTKDHKLSGLNNRSVLSHLSGG